MVNPDELRNKISEIVNSEVDVIEELFKYFTTEFTYLEKEVFVAGYMFRMREESNERLFTIGCN